MAENNQKPVGETPEYIALVVHQLRSPLTVMRGYLELLAEEKTSGPLSETQKEYVTAIAEVNEHMRKLVNDFMDVAKLESRTAAFTFADLSLREFIQKLITEFGVLADQKAIIIETELEDLKISADEKFLSHAVSNLLSNAVKYTPEKGRVRILARRSGENFIIEVADSGYGIPADEQPKIFEPFYRASNIREHEPVGTGLGLYIARLIIEQMAGTISFVSSTGKGATFTIQLPIKGKQVTFGYERR